MFEAEAQVGEDLIRMFTGSGSLRKLPEILRASGNDRAALIYDPALPSDVVSRVVAVCSSVVATLALPSPENGEGAKTLRAVEDVLDNLVPHLTRDSVIISLGGATVTNLAGVCAALLFRGISLIHVPTTVMAQADGAIGLKQAVNANGIKNVYGAFLAPTCVVNDTDFLRSLPPRHFTLGFAEIGKVAFALAGPLLQLLLSKADPSRPTVVPEQDLPEIIHLAADAKFARLPEDPREVGSLRLMEIGHTTAHALETATQGRMHHGQAVIQGIFIEAAYAAAHGRPVDPCLFMALDRLFVERLGYTTMSAVDSVAFRSALERSNKRGRDGLEAVLPLGPGEVEVVPSVDITHLTDLVERLPGKERRHSLAAAARAVVAS